MPQVQWTHVIYYHSCHLSEIDAHQLFKVTASIIHKKLQLKDLSAIQDSGMVSIWF